ncbi:hypothetical protein IMZ48_32200 [Candidatus Bathyarchaeota archaeon]|nr:hypothetical protein [Candidatus Bathyarchaeota archaeon]
MVLEKDSSVLGYPGEVSMPLEGDHHEVCKYESRVDPRYVAVRNVLKSLIKKGKQESMIQVVLNQLGQQLTNFQGPPRDPPNKIPEIPLEQLLSVPETPERDYNFFRDRWTQGTCSWILNDTAFAK